MHARLLRIAAATTLTATAVALLSGCTSTEQSATPDSNPATARPTASAPSHAPTLRCIDGFLLVDADALGESRTITLDEGCDVVDVVGSRGTVVVPSASTLIVEGTSNTITVTKGTEAASVKIAGDDNTVTITGPAPKVDDKGTGNVITTKP